MSFYRTEKNLPKSDKLKPLSDRVASAIAPIITDQFNKGATAEEILGAIIQTVVAEVSDQTISRTITEYKEKHSIVTIELVQEDQEDQRRCLPMRLIDEVREAIVTSPFVVEAEDWHDGQGFSPLYICPNMDTWEAFKAKSEVSDMSFRLRETATGEILDSFSPQLPLHDPRWG